MSVILETMNKPLDSATKTAEHPPKQKRSVYLIVNCFSDWNPFITSDYAVGGDYDQSK